MRRWRSVVMAWLCCSAMATAGVRVLPPGAVLVDPDRTDVSASRTDADATRILVEIGKGDADAALARLEDLADPLRFELAAARVIETLQAQPSTKAGDAVLATLERAPIRVYRRHEETAADWFLPLIDVPGRAVSARRLHAFAHQRDALSAKLQRDPSALGKTESADVVAAAIEQVPDDTALQVAELALAGRIDLPSPAWTALARREPQPAILEAALARAAPVDVLPLFDVLLHKLPPDVALTWLESAARRSDYASVAVMNLGALAPRSRDAEAALVKHLGDPATGASAAAALSLLAVPDRLQRIDALLAKVQAPAVVADLALALRLEGSEAALQRLRKLESDPRLPAATKAELQR